jgi:GDP-4-dehydro-6-deoxy-D-mannose reductase
MIRIMCDHLQISVTVKENRQLLRPKDNAVIIGSNEKIRRDTGWTAEVPFEESVRRLLDHFGSRYSGKQLEYSGLSRKY